MCDEHKKIFEIVCMTCCKRICSLCAIFGVHKKHNLMSEKEVIEDLQNKVESICEIKFKIE